MLIFDIWSCNKLRLYNDCVVVVGGGGSRGVNSENNLLEDVEIKMEMEGEGLENVRNVRKC